MDINLLGFTAYVSTAVISALCGYVFAKADQHSPSERIKQLERQLAAYTTLVLGMKADLAEAYQRLGELEPPTTGDFK